MEDGEEGTVREELYRQSHDNIFTLSQYGLTSDTPPKEKHVTPKKKKTIIQQILETQIQLFTKPEVKQKE